MTRPTPRTRAKVVLTVLFTVCASCVVPAPPPPSTTGPDPDEAAQADSATYSVAGPFAAGVTTIELEPGRHAEVWYPAPPESVGDRVGDSYHIRDFLSDFLDGLLPPSVDPVFRTDAYRDLPAVDGRFPLVLFSHGAASYRLQSTFLTTHLATWGFVVVSPDYFERGLPSILGVPPAAVHTDAFVTDLAVAAAQRLDSEAGPLQGRVDTSRLFPIGHSAGGYQSTRLAGYRTDVQSWISMAAGISLQPSVFDPAPVVPAALGDPTKSAMWLAGENDGVVPLGEVLDAFTYTGGPRKLVTLPLSGHNNAFSDICEIARDQGGLVGLAYSAGLPIPDALADLARSGCIAPPNFLGDQVWPVVRHFVTAELRFRSGLDPEPVGLGSGVVSAFGAVTPVYRHDP